MMNRWHLKWTGTLAVGLIGAALALPVVPAGAAVPNLGGVVGGVIGGNGGGVADPGPTVRPVHVAVDEFDLVDILKSGFQGRVIIPAGASFNMSRWQEIELTNLVELVGERGPMGSRPLIETRKPGVSFPLFKIVGHGVRVEGIHFRGPANGNLDKLQAYANAIQVVQNPQNSQGRYVVIADNEFDEWTGSGVNVENALSYVIGEKAYAEDSDLPEKEEKYPHLRSADAGLVRVERNYFHHNARLDGGYGVSVGSGSFAIVEYNVFDFNRHAVAAGGWCTGYKARFNYALQGGYPYPDNGYYGQHFDVHGTAPGYNGGRAGEYIEVAFNTIRGEQDYGGHLGVGGSTRAAFELRGRPANGAYFQNNVVVHDNRYEAIRLKSGGDATLDARFDSTFNLHESNNRYDTDYSMEVATGDFDGDRLTDVFVANGTAWFFSRGGQRPWEFLHASTKRTRELGFADIDNDGITDVLYRDANGSLGFLKSGRQDLVNFTTAPVPMRELRFGDFDGDGKTDIFYTLGNRWWIWYGKSRTWTATQSASAPVSDMLFGEFDGVRGTDLVAAVGNDWLMSSGAAAGWTRLNAKLRNTVADAVAADFDGNGKTDIAFNDGDRWVFSRDGTSPLTVLRAGDAMTGYPRLKEQIIGQFENDAGAEVVSFEYKKFPLVNLYLPGERLVFWRGLATGGGIGFYTSAYEILSQQNMR